MSSLAGIGFGRDGYNRYWWEFGENETHRGIVAAVRGLDQAQRYRDEMNLHHARLYSGRFAQGLSGKDYQISERRDLLKFNICKSVCDTALSFVGSKRPRNEYSTFEGSWKDKVKAKRLTRFMAGQMQTSGQYRLNPHIFLDALVFGTGLEFVGNDNGKIRLERVFPNELIVDDAEANYGEPRSVIRYQDVAAEVLAGKYPEHAEMIMRSGVVREQIEPQQQSSCKMVSWMEAWHLPTDEHEGRHSICTNEATLFDEEWTRDRFPIAKYQWGIPLLGFWGVGLVEELTPIQIEINYLLAKIQRIMTLATMQVWIKKGDSVARNSLNNMDLAVREYVNNPPVVMPIPAVDPSYFSQVQYLVGQGYELAGISKLRSQGEKPAGLNSGAAIRSYDDLGDARFQEKSLRWEAFHIDVGELIIDVAEEIQDEGGEDLEVLTSGDKQIERLKFSDCRMERNRYSVRPFPTSLLPDTPAGKLQAISDLSELAPEFKPYLMKALDMPDVGGFFRNANSKVDAIEFQLSRILEDGEPQTPTGEFDLELCLDLGASTKRQWIVDRVPTERLLMLDDWLARVNFLKQQRDNPPMPSTPPGMGPPMEGQAPAMPPEQPMPPEMQQQGAPMPGAGPQMM